jgi:hypothetical protein
LAPHPQFRAPRREEGIKRKEMLQSLEVTYYTKTEIIAAETGRKVIATSRTTIARNTVPRATTYYTVCPLVFS